MAFSEALAARVRQALARRKGIVEKKMFGGIGFLLNGNLLVGVRKDSLLVRLDPSQSDEVLKEAHVSELKITGRGTMKGWLVVGLQAIETGEQLKGWIQQAVKFVGKLPAK
jgi:TfoX/Sxy family transcriptional regulator of competence genes